MRKLMLYFRQIKHGRDARRDVNILSRLRKYFARSAMSALTRPMPHDNELDATINGRRL